MTSPVGETQLTTLLAHMQPQLQPTVFVFATVSASQPRPEIEPICQFREAEGLTLILPQSQADRAQLTYEYPCRLITLTVHSSLAAVGLLAAVTEVLAAQQISANVVSAFYHDHVFVPCDRAEAALTCLQQLAHQAEHNRTP